MKNQNEKENEKKPVPGSPVNINKNLSTEAITKSASEAVEKAKNSSDVIVIKSEKTKEDEEKDSLIIIFARTYSFEGTEYDRVDLSGIKELTTRDLTAAEKMFYSSGNIAPINEMSTAYTTMVAARATNLPIELFENLKANDAVKIKNAVSSFLLS